MKRYTIAVGVAVALAALAALVAPAQAAEGVTVSRFPFSASFLNPCTNENIDFSGTILVVLDTTQDNRPALDGHSVNIAVKGVGQTTGTQYVWVFTNTVTDTTSDTGAAAETTTTYERIVAPGPGNDLLFTIVFHETINANGDVVAFFNRLIIEPCV
jgi:hypothetical protein